MWFGKLKCSPLRTLRPQDVGVNTQKCWTFWFSGWVGCAAEVVVAGGCGDDHGVGLVEEAGVDHLDLPARHVGRRHHRRPLLVIMMLRARSAWPVSGNGGRFVAVGVEERLERHHQLQLDVDVVRAGCPVIRSTRVSAMIWSRVRPSPPATAESAWCGVRRSRRCLARPGDSR